MTDTTKNKMIIALAIFAAFVSILLTVIIVITKNRISNLKQTEQLYITVTADLKIAHNKDSTQTATIEVLTSENTNLFTKLVTKDGDIIRLQNVVKTYEKKNGDLNTAIIISNETALHLKDSITNLIIGHSAHKDSTGAYYPVYYQKLNRQWYSGSITMGYDTLDLQLKIRNEYNVTIGDQKVSLFKKKYYANITNLNPDTETTVMKVYQKQEVKTGILKPLTLNNIVGILEGLGIGYLLFH
jgi:Na+-translocating ferredoxin:NAD+ oxidoreductase RnfG subunit